MRPLCAESRSCCSSMFSLKIPTVGFFISLCRTQLCPPNPLKAARGISNPSPASERGWGGPTLPVLSSWEQNEGDTGAQSSCRQGVTLQLRIPVGAPWSEGSQPDWGVPKSGVPQVLEPWDPGPAQGTIFQPEIGGSEIFSVYVSNLN